MDDQSTPLQQLFEGIGIVLLFLLALFIFAYAAFDTWSDWGINGPTSGWTEIPMFLLAFCGLTQAVYVIPAVLFLKKRNMPQVAKGVVLGAVLVLVVDLLVLFLGTR